MIVFGGDYEHTIEVSSVQNGIELEYCVLSRPELFAKVLERQDFDACEFSLSNYIMMRDRGADWLTAIPVFPNRAFRHGTMLVRQNDAIESFADLVGKRVGIADYTMTGGVWGRGIYAEYYQLHWSQVEWFSSGKPRFTPPESARVRVLDEDIEDALAAGKLDAILYPRSRDALLPAAKRRFRPVIKNWRAAELDYFKSSGIYPISHVLVLPRDKIAHHPDLPGAVIAAYTHSMTRTKQRRLASSFLPWGDATWSDIMEIFGGDPLPYGLGAENKATIAKLQDYLFEQELIGSRSSLPELFWPN
jgi:4,5-dihydroxyphthalate decarboxylase